MNILITGASSGIGEYLTRYYAKNSDRLFLLARRVEKLKEIKNSLNLINDQIFIYECDVSKQENVHNVVSEILNSNSIDIFIGNAGISESTPAQSFNSDIFKKTIETNVFGITYFLDLLLPHFSEKNSGQFVFISSLASYRGLPGAAAYCASKSALNALAESVRQDLRGSKIKVNLICPGFIKTPLTDRNVYKMPFLMDTEKGVSKIIQAIKKNKKIYSFPWQLALIVRIARLLPPCVYDFLLSGKRNIKR